MPTTVSEWVEVPWVQWVSPGTAYHWQHRLQHSSGIALEVSKESDQSVRVVLRGRRDEIVARLRLWDGPLREMACEAHRSREFRPLIDAALDALRGEE